MFLDELLDSLKDSFLDMFKHRITKIPVDPTRFEFEAQFERILHKHEEDAKARRKKTQKNFDETQLAKVDLFCCRQGFCKIMLNGAGYTEPER